MWSRLNVKMLEKNIVEDAKNFGVRVVPSRDPSPYLRILRERRVEAGQRNRDGHFREPPARTLIPGVKRTALITCVALRR